MTAFGKLFVALFVLLIAFMFLVSIAYIVYLHQGSHPVVTSAYYLIKL